METNPNFNNIVNLFLERFGDDLDAPSKNKPLEPIWDLGELVMREINKRMTFDEFISLIVPQIINKTDLKSNTIVRNLRVSSKVVKLYPKKEDWVKITPKIGNFKKLKLLENLLNPDYRKKYGIPDEEITNLMSRIEDLNGEEVGVITKEINSRYIKMYIDIDYDTIWENCQSINSNLKEVIDNNDLNFINNIRKNYTQTKIYDIRLLLSMIKNEEIFQKYHSKFNSFNFMHELKNTRLTNFNVELKQLLRELMKTEKTDRLQRETMRKEIPLLILGQISTQLKALSEDKELERYKIKKAPIGAI
jgi:hypothetical protein